MKRCKLCVMPDIRPDIVFNSEGICNACLFERQKELGNRLEPARKRIFRIC